MDAFLRRQDYFLFQLCFLEFLDKVGKNDELKVEGLDSILVFDVCDPTNSYLLWKVSY